jgi:ferric-dicitrate binding protein FerR (iron transport regulator)
MTEHEQTYYEELIARYLNGEASHQEVTELTAWVKTSNENTKLFSSYHSTWLKLTESKVHRINIDEEWFLLQSRIILTGKDIPAPKRMNKVTQKIIPLFTPVVMLRAAAILLLALIPAILYLLITNPRIHLLSAYREPLEQQLPDGTQVTLNTGSTLEYPAWFHGRKRDVTLQGEAWFHVAQNKIKPFILSVGDVRIEVLGTSFYVNATGITNNIEVILASGQVALYFRSEAKQKVLMHTGEAAVIDATGKSISVSVNDDPNFLAWKTKKIIFNDDPLYQIIATLNHVYRCNIILAQPALSGCRITATFDNQSLESVLHVIQATLNVRITETGGTIEISGTGCN